MVYRLWFYIEERPLQLFATSCEKKARKKDSGLNAIQTHHLCNASKVLYQLSYQAYWELVKFIRMNKWKWIYIWTVGKRLNLEERTSQQLKKESLKWNSDFEEYDFVGQQCWNAIIHALRHLMLILNFYSHGNFFASVAWLEKHLLRCNRFSESDWFSFYESVTNQVFIYMYIHVQYVLRCCRLTNRNV